MIFRAIRSVFYTLLFVFSTILIGLTAYRIHYTKSLSHGDILTTKTHFYDPRIVALLVVSILALLFSVVILATIVASVDILVAEHVCIWGLWIFFLVTVAVVNKEWSNLKWCRSHHKECRILETIKAFGWICWGFLTILLVTTLIKLVMRRTRDQGTTRGTRGTAPATTYDTRQATTTTPIHDQPRTQATPTQGVPTTTTHVPQSKNASQPAPTYATQPPTNQPPITYANQPQSAAGALYQRPGTTDPMYTDRTSQAV